MERKKDESMEHLPQVAQEYIRELIKSIRYRKKVRRDVQAELVAHFEDVLKDCKDDQQRTEKCKKLIEEFGDPKTLGKLTRRAKKRCRPLWKKTLIKSLQAIGIFILLFVLYVAWFLSGKPKIETNYLAKYNQWVRPAADESSNAAPYYDQAVEKLGEVNDKVKKLLSKDFDEVNDIEVEKIATWLADNNEVFELIERGSQKPYYWKTVTTNDPNQPNRLLGILMPHLSEYRTIAYGLNWRAYIEANQGNFEGAFKDIETAYILGRHNKGNKTLVENLVGISIQAMTIGTFRSILNNFEIPVEYLTKWQSEFKEMIQDENFVAQGFMGEKMMLYDEIQRSFVDSWFGIEHLYLRHVSGIVEMNSEYLIIFIFSDVETDDFLKMGKNISYVLFTHPDKQQTRQQADEFYDLWEEYAKKTPAQVKREDIDVDKEVEKLTSQNILLNLLAAPAFEKVIQIHYRTKIDIQSTLPLLAILRYEKENGHYPESLEVLVEQGYLDEIPTDPFSDEPIKYRKTYGNFVLYSVGMNMVDDGGVHAIKPYNQKKVVWEENGDAVFWPVE